MKKIKILWTDDEIDLLRPHIIFLEEKGYLVETASNGDDALVLVSEQAFDIIFLDENMPGMSGLETLSQIKQIRGDVPVVMITKSEEESIMDQAVGAQIADYLIKPVNPKQILLTIKKNVDKVRLVTEKTTSDYQVSFRELGMQISDARTHQDWAEAYRKLVYWEMELARSDDHTMDEVLKMQKEEANSAFMKFIERNYLSWFEKDCEDRPLLSPGLFREKVLPLLEKGKTLFLMIDNLRYDQWKVLQPVISKYFFVAREESYYSILPTATQYSRNAIFAGLMPSEIARMQPDIWKNDDEEGGKNLYEEQLLEKQLARHGHRGGFSYEKINNNRDGKKVNENINSLLKNDLSVVIYNFVDILSHARTEMNMIRELAGDEAAYRSLTLSWFEHSPLLEMLQQLAEKGVKVILTTDHGTIRVQNPVKVVGDRQTTTNLRYKQGKSLGYDKKEVFEVKRPEDAYLPKTTLNASYIFAKPEDFFAYPNNYNHYVKYYRDTFQHGGVSLEEMILPLVELTPR